MKDTAYFALAASASLATDMTDLVSVRSELKGPWRRKGDIKGFELPAFDVLFKDDVTWGDLDI